MPASLGIRTRNYGSPRDPLTGLNRGLVAWWRGAPMQPGGRTWVDLAARRAATLRGSASWGGHPAPGGTLPLGCDGVSGYLDCITSTNSFLSVTSKSCCLWLKPVGTAPVVANVYVGRSVITDSNGRNFGLYRSNISSTDRIWAYNWDGNEDSIGVAYTVGEWMHVAYVHDGTTLSIYKNGVLGGSLASGATTDLSSILFIGAGNTGISTNFWIGLLDDIRLYNIPLSASRVRTLYDVSRLGYPQDLTWQVWPPAWAAVPVVPGKAPPPFQRPWRLLRRRRVG
jgi:hypothetical protein